MFVTNREYHENIFLDQIEFETKDSRFVGVFLLLLQRQKAMTDRKD